MPSEFDPRANYTYYRSHHSRPENFDYENNSDLDGFDPTETSLSSSYFRNERAPWVGSSRDRSISVCRIKSVCIIALHINLPYY